MRVVAALSALLLLAGCDMGASQPQKDGASAAEATDFATTGSGYDYRYAYRLPGEKLKQALQSNADACDKLTPMRCRILAMRYRVDNGNKTRAVLTINIDPTIARNYGEAVTKAVNGAGGVLVDTEVTGPDSTNAMRNGTLVRKLQEQLATARSQSGGEGSDASAAKARADRLRNALDTIAELDPDHGQSLANSPVLITYESASALTGLGSTDANFKNAGSTLESSVARLLIVLGAIGPWAIALILIVAVLRFIVHGRGGGSAAEDEEDHDEPAHHESRNLIQRWFARDDDDQPQPHS